MSNRIIKWNGEYIFTDHIVSIHYEQSYHDDGTWCVLLFLIDGFRRSIYFDTEDEAKI